jgi:NB-ARC domain/Tetratricopeptide repeat
VVDALTQQLFTPDTGQKVALVGLGGIGKTQVALQLAYWTKENKPECSVFWVPATNNASFEQAYTEIARKLAVRKSTEDEGLKESVRRCLSLETTGKWLLIVDNADDMDILFGSRGMSDGIHEYLPESEDGLILFTTRSREVAVAVVAEMIEIPEMEEQNAIEMLEKSLARKDLLCDKEGVTELLQELTYLPLAITQAAAYLSRNRVSITKYVELLRGTEQDAISLMSREFHDNTRYKGVRNAVATTWLVSFDQIRKLDGPAADLLSFISCIEPKAIPQSILPHLSSEEDMVYAIGTLDAYAFMVRRGNTGVFDMHSLVHLATRIWVQRNVFTVQAKRTATQHLATVFPYNDYENRDCWRAYLPHALRILQGDGALDMEKRYTLCIKVGLCLQADGRTREALKYLEECSQWRNNHLHQDHPDRLASQHELAGAYQANGQVKEAVSLLEQVVKIQE